MKAAVVVFPASNCDRDAAIALEQITGEKPTMIWHADSELPDVDLVVLPGGFAHGDYLRCGAMAALSPIMRDIKVKADKGLTILGICNGFQVLTEAGMLPGVLIRNAALKFVCKPVAIKVEESQSAFTRKYENGQRISFPVANGIGNYFADEATTRTARYATSPAFLAKSVTCWG
jgi:phosphoribosylformylglycinamidine synthase